LSEAGGGHTKAEIGHELNNLLAAIQGNADLMRGDFGGVEAIREGLDEIDKAVTRARDIARKLLAEPTHEAPAALGEPARAAPVRKAQEPLGQTVLIADVEEPVRRVA
jgi:signal transduction histidine kinase